MLGHTARRIFVQPRILAATSKQWYSCMEEGTSLHSSRFLSGPFNSPPSSSGASLTAASTSTATSGNPNRSTGIQQPRRLSNALSTFMGVSEAARTAVVKQIWKHIKEKNLLEKRQITPDARLSPILGSESFDMFQLGKKLNDHILPSTMKAGTGQGSEASNPKSSVPTGSGGAMNKCPTTPPSGFPYSRGYRST